MPTKVELMKQLKESQENEKKGKFVCMNLIQRLTELELNFNLLVDLINDCDCEHKLDQLKDAIKHVDITIEEV